MNPIVLLTNGTRGDVQPYVALARGLHAAGYRACIVAPVAFGDFVLQHGVEFAPIDGNPSEWLMRAGGQAALTFDGNVFRNARATLNYWQAVRPVYARMLASAWEACRALRPSMLVIGLPTLWGIHIAEALRVPCVGAYLQPLTPTRAFPSVLWPTRFSLGAGYNRLTHFITAQALWLPWRDLINHWRTTSLGLPTLYQSPISNLSLYGISPAVLPRPADWPASHTLTGYWFLDESVDWIPPAALLRFLDAPAPAVYVGFGSPGVREARPMLARFIQALETAQVRVVLALPEGATTAPLPPNIFPLSHAPHTWLFPRVRGVVHHGGAGTTAAALRAAVPQLLLPLAIDQFFWGERLAALQVGPRPIPQRALTVNKLAAALRQLVEDETLHTNASAIGEMIRSEAGVEKAVNVLRGMG